MFIKNIMYNDPDDVVNLENPYHLLKLFQFE